MEKLIVVTRVRDDHYLSLVAYQLASLIVDVDEASVLQKTEALF